MTEWHMKSRRKPSGGILRTVKRSDKKLAWKGGDFSSTAIVQNEEDVLIQKGKGKTRKPKAKKVKFASVTDQETKKTTKAEIIKVIENPANRHYTRRNIITKGAIIQVKIAGKEASAKVTSRPGQAGIVGAVLLSEKEAEELEKAKEKKPKAKKRFPKPREKKPEKNKEEEPAGEKKEEEKKEEDAKEEAKAEEKKEQQKPAEEEAKQEPEKEKEVAKEEKAEEKKKEAEG